MVVVARHHRPPGGDPAVQRPAAGTRRLVPDALRRDPQDRWAAAFGRIAGYSFAVAVVSGVPLLPFFRPSMTTLVYHGSYRLLDGAAMSQAYQSRPGRRHPAPMTPPPSNTRTSPARASAATREAAEDELYRRERERAEQAEWDTALIKQLRRAMADAHPDRGGTVEQFIEAHCRYQTALRPARR